MSDFQVFEEVEVQDLTAVPDSDQTILPPARGVLVEISRPKVNVNEGKDLKVLSLGLKLVEGIEVDDPEQGQVFKYKGMFVNHGWMDFCFYADPTTRNSDWWKAGKAFITFKQLVKALDLPLQGLKINDEFLANLNGKQIRVDIVQEKDTTKDAEGNRVKTGTISNKVKNIKKAE